MRAVGYRVRCLLIAHWRRSVFLGLAVGVVGGIVLALGAGAARTSSAPDRFTEAWGEDFDATLQQGGGEPRNAEVAGLPGVASVEAVTFVFGVLSTPAGASETEAVDAEAVVFAGSYRAVGMRLVKAASPTPHVPRSSWRPEALPREREPTSAPGSTSTRSPRSRPTVPGSTPTSTEGGRGPSGEATSWG